MARAAAARRYAKALYGLAREEGRVGEVQGELASMADLLAESGELRGALFRPLYPVSERRRVLERVADRLETTPVVKNFYLFLVEQRRLVDFEAIRAEYARLADLDVGRIRAEVRTASPLDDAQLDRLRRALGGRTDQNVELSIETDPSLLGGAVAKVGDLVFDGSLRSQLRQLRANLMKGQ